MLRFPLNQSVSLLVLALLIFFSVLLLSLGTVLAGTAITPYGLPCLARRGPSFPLQAYDNNKTGPGYGVHTAPIQHRHITTIYPPSNQRILLGPASSALGRLSQPFHWKLGLFLLAQVPLPVWYSRPVLGCTTVCLSVCLSVCPSITTSKGPSQLLLLLLLLDTIRSSLRSSSIRPVQYSTARATSPRPGGLSFLDPGRLLSHALYLPIYPTLSSSSNLSLSSFETTAELL